MSRPVAEETMVTLRNILEEKNLFSQRIPVVRHWVSVCFFSFFIVIFVLVIVNEKEMLSLTKVSFLLIEK